MSRPDKRLQIMRAAEKVFRAARFEEVTLEQVARAADVGKGTIYLYFQDKEDLFFQTATSGFDQLCALVRAGCQPSSDFRDQLLNVCRLLHKFYTKRKRLLRIIFDLADRMDDTNPRLRQAWAAHRRQMILAVAAIMQRGMDQGVVRSPLPAEVLAMFFLGMLRTRACDMEGMPTAIRTHEQVVDLFCHGVCAGKTSVAENPATG